MKAFLSHSSHDKSLVSEVYDAIEPESVWLDRGEIEWGDVFIEKIEDGIKNASDFILFWSAHSAESEWVRLELNMALIQSLKRRAIRLRVIRLDRTELPLYLQHFHYLSVVDSLAPASDIIDGLRRVLREPTRGVRHQFLNRNSELERLETLLNDSDTKVIILNGFRGIGKTSLAHETFRRFYESASVVNVPVTGGMRSTELAIRLCYEANLHTADNMSELESLAAIENAIQELGTRGQFLVFRDCQHWLGGERELEEPLPTILRQAVALSETSRNPIILTSTRRPQIPVEIAQHVSLVRVDGLSQEHMASITSLWYELSEGKPLELDRATNVARELHGHPVAAKLAASLVAQYGVDHLLQYPRELVALRLDLAKTLIQDLGLGPSAKRLMETLSIIGVPVPSRLLAGAIGTSEDNFLDAVEETSRSGIVETTDAGHLTVHPLVADYYWRSHLHHDDYQDKSARVAEVVHAHFRELSTESISFVLLLPVVVRLYGLSGNIDRARNIRRDLVGELSQAAITHYNRRQYDLAEAFINEILAEHPNNWRIRQCLARIHIRKHRWSEADELIGALLKERPRDIGTLHMRGWRWLRAGEYERALDEYIHVLSYRGDHIASLRDAADCLHRLGRMGEALDFLERAKQVESDNPFVLELEARILEEMGQFEKALVAARVAVIRDPVNWSQRHRLSQILSKLGRQEEALERAQEAHRLDPAQFTALSSLVSLMLEAERTDEAVEYLKGLRRLSANQHQKQICDHLQARALLHLGDYAASLEIVEAQIKRRVNLAAGYGLYVRIKLDLFERMENKVSANARLMLQQAKSGLESCEAQPDHNHGTVDRLKERLAELEQLSAR